MCARATSAAAQQRVVSLDGAGRGAAKPEVPSFAAGVPSQTPHADESGDLVAELVEQMQRSTTSEEHELAHAMAAGLLASVQTIEEVPS